MGKSTKLVILIHFMSPARSSPEYLWCNFTRVSLHYYFSPTLSSEETKVPSVEKRYLELKLHELLALLSWTPLIIIFTLSDVFSSEEFYCTELNVEYV